jgi:hypothetical protein
VARVVEVAMELESRTGTTSVRTARTGADMMVWSHTAATFFYGRQEKYGPGTPCARLIAELDDPESDLAALSHCDCDCCDERGGRLVRLILMLEDETQIEVDVSEKDAVIWEWNQWTDKFWRDAYRGNPDCLEMIERLRDGYVSALCHTPDCDCCELQLTPSS